MKPTFKDQHKELDPSAVDIPMALDWTDWIEAFGPGVWIVDSVWNIPAPLTSTPDIIVDYSNSDPDRLLHYTLLNVSGNNAEPGTYECENHIKVSRNYETQTPILAEDSRRLYIHVRKL